MYSPPLYGHRDPTSVTAPFFFLYFGMCLADAGYALIMMGVLWMLFNKYRNIPKNTKTFMRMFFYSAVATFFYGLFTGGIFADLVDILPFVAFLRPVKGALTIIDPMASSMTILGLSLFLGVFQLMFGLGIAAWDEYRAGNIIGAISEKLSWIFFVMGLIVFGGGKAGIVPSLIGSIGMCAAIVGACLVFWSSGRESDNIFAKLAAGLYGIYGITGYMGDILSYSRLLALGLGGGIMGSVVNMMGSLTVDIPYFGWLLATIIVVFGHMFSLAINLLGAFIHAMRLQFVEYFGKFYSGDGTIFKPLRLQTRYVLISDEN
jgi:V/A-type H+-transporting ATPase subunit I